MNHALCIFRKDVRHHWPAILLVLALVTFAGWMNVYYAEFNPLEPLVELIWLAACAYLGASVVQEERLTGDQQYWLTRPIARRQLLLAKLVFLLLFVSVPQLVQQAIALRVVGIAPWRHTPGLLATSLGFGSVVGIAVAALAAVTATLLEVAYALLGLAALAVVSSTLTSPARGLGSLEWMRDWAGAALIAAASAGVLFIQYFRRRTATARVLLSLAAIAVAAASYLASWGTAFALQSTLRKRDRAGSIAVAPDLAATRRASATAIGGYSATIAEEGTAIPVVVTGIPAGSALLSERISVTVEASDGRTWRSGWTPGGGLTGTDPLEDYRVLRGDGPAWQYANVDAAFARAVAGLPVTVRARAALTLLGDAQSAPLKPRGRTRGLPLDGVCMAEPNRPRNVIVACAWPLGHPARAYIRAGRLVSLLSGSTSFSSYPVDATLWHRAATVFSDPGEAQELRLESWRAVAHFEREWEIRGVRLQEFTVPRLTGGR